MNSGSCFKTLVIVAVVNVTFDRILCIDNFRSMTFSNGVTPIASHNVTLYTLKSFQGISRIDCFSKCLGIPSSCVGVCLDKSHTNVSCRLLTYELTGEPLSFASMETARIAIWKRDGKFISYVLCQYVLYVYITVSFFNDRNNDDFDGFGCL